MKILAVDPGEKRIGLAISDPTGTISRPYMVIKHESREKDARKIADIAYQENVSLIVVGWALDLEGNVGPQARKSERLADAVRQNTEVPIKMWDESNTTQRALNSRIALGVPRRKRKGHLDDLAASVLLQDFLICNEDLIKDDD